MEKKLVTVQLSGTMADALRQTAQREFTSISSIVRRAVAAHLKTYAGDQTDCQPQGGGAASGGGKPVQNR